jgi:hypothetical protein
MNLAGSRMPVRVLPLCAEFKMNSKSRALHRQMSVRWSVCRLRYQHGIQP